MWILINIVLKTSSLGSYIPSYEKLIVHNTFDSCEADMENIYRNIIKLKANYPVEVEYKFNNNNEKFIEYSYKPDYTRPKEVSYYHCMKMKKK